MLNRLILISCIILSSYALMACDSGGNGDGGSNWCPGTICNNCATDCTEIDLNCAADEQEACVGGAYFDADPNLRCAFCLKE